jgi:predicted DNA-binding transcriptional regulator AlpA
VPTRYATTQIRGTTIRVHRAIWEGAFGPIPDGFVVMHWCDNPPCINPGHLTTGTTADNIADMYAKGRDPYSKFNAKYGIVEPPKAVSPSVPAAPLRLIKYEQLVGMGITYSRERLVALEKRGLFPLRVRLGGRGHGLWLLHEINEWLRS